MFEVNWTDGARDCENTMRLITDKVIPSSSIREAGAGARWGGVKPDRGAGMAPVLPVVIGQI